MSTLKVNTISHNTPGQTITVSDSLLVDELKVGNSTSSALVSPYNFKNKIINGDMIVAQRGETWTSAPNNTFPVDRWVYNKSSTTAVATLSRTNLNTNPIPSNHKFIRALKVQVTTADGAPQALTSHFLRQAIEGFNIKDLIDRTFTVSFWVRSSKTGVFSIFINNDPENSSDTTCRSYIYDYTISSANTWEYKTFTINDGLPSSGIWEKESGIGLNLGFVLAIGSSLKTSTVGSWISGTAAYLNASTSMTNNLFDTVGATFELTGVQLELGSTATEFEILPFSTILNLCDRYCQAHYIRDNNFIATGGLNNYYISPITHRAHMRTTPTATILSSTFSTGISSTLSSIDPESNYSSVISLYYTGVTFGSADILFYLDSEMI